MNGPCLLLSEVAAELRTSVSTVRHWIRTGKLAAEVRLPIVRGSRAARECGGRAVEAGDSGRAPLRATARRADGAAVGGRGLDRRAARREPRRQSGPCRLAEERAHAGYPTGARRAPRAQGPPAKVELVFPGPAGRMLHSNETKHPLWRACRRAGLLSIGWHVLRHSFASHLVMRGAPIRGAQELLGHSTIEMTMRYAHLSPNVTREIVGLLDRVGCITGTDKVPGSQRVATS